MYSIGIIIIGDELLVGRRTDKHLQHVIEVLTARGLQLAWVHYVGDDAAQLVAAFQFARQQQAICFSFGGIGATPDDRTRQAIAKAHNVRLTRHPQAVAAIEKQFAEGAYPHRILMAELPQQAELIPNPVNNIPGFSLGSIHCLPGFPEMAWPMLDWLLENYYTNLESTEIVYHSVLLFNSHESDLIPLMQEFEAAYPEIKISSLPSLKTADSEQIELGVTGEVTTAGKVFAALCEALDANNFAYKKNIK